jgi:hypothetical protein
MECCNTQTPPFPQCTACSTHVQTAFRSNAEVFTRKVCADPQWLEQVSGIAALMQAVDFDGIDLSDDGDGDF